MKFILSRSEPFRCPHCGSDRLRRSHTHGLFELLLRRVFAIKPLRCTACHYRHLRFRPDHVPHAEAS